MKGFNKAQRRELTIGLLFVLPNLICFALFTLIPVITGLAISFTNYDGFDKMDFVGLSNYVRLFKDSYFSISLRNNFVYMLICVPAQLVCGLLLAMGIAGKSKLNALLKVMLFFPSITSMVVVSMVWMVLLNPVQGPINQALMAMGIANPPGWLTSSSWALYTVIFIMVWKSSGYYMVMFFGGLQAIPDTLYEAASIDGANRLRQFWHITIPLLSPTTFMVMVLATINSFKVFDAIKIMTNGGPGRSTNVLVFRIYQESFVYYRFGYGSAIAMVLFVIVLILTLIQFRGQKKWVTYY